MTLTSSTFIWVTHSPIQETPLGAGTTISLHLLLLQAIFIPRTPSSLEHLCSSPSISLPKWRTPINPNGSQHMRTQDIDLLRLYGWPTETEKYIHVTEGFFPFSKGYQVLIETLQPVTLTFLYPPSPPTPLIYGEDSLCFPQQTKK